MPCTPRMESMGCPVPCKGVLSAIPGRRAGAPQHHARTGGVSSIGEGRWVMLHRQSRVPLSPAAFPAPLPGNGSGGCSSSLALMPPPKTPARANCPAALHALRSKSSAGTQLAVGPMPGQRARPRSPREPRHVGSGWGSACPGVQHPASSLAPTCGSWHPTAVGSDSQLCSLAPSPGVWRPSLGLSTHPWGSASSPGIWHPALGLSTQLRRSAPSCRVWRSVAGLSTHLWGAAP